MSCFDTANVLSMKCLFGNCESLTVDVGSSFFVTATIHQMIRQARK